MSIAAANQALVGGSAAAQKPMEKAAFIALYEETAPRLRSYLRRSARDPALADDLLQETFCRLLRAPLPPLEGPQLRGYLYRTANSLLTDHWRRAKRERRWTSLFQREEPAAQRHPLQEDLDRVFAMLKPREQTLLWLAYIEGLDHREIASALALSERSVRVLLFRARKKLAGLCARSGIGPEQVANQDPQKGTQQ